MGVNARMTLEQAEHRIGRLHKGIEYFISPRFEDGLYEVMIKASGRWYRATINGLDSEYYAQDNPPAWYVGDFKLLADEFSEEEIEAAISLIQTD